MFNELGKRLGIKSTDVSYLTKKEIMDFLSGKKINIEAIKERREGFAIYFNDEHNIECKSGDAAIQVIKELGLEVKSKQPSQIRGIPASPGVATGAVIIVKKISELYKVKTGSILVTVTTHPDYVPVMKKAAAVVTDEGGITSHAAIVSRELGLPCIVGTQNATKFLKDGDIVEVDANSGVVSIVGPKKGKSNR
jgi:phosphoenolpyruvate synthase/pyruvate phosphate dikinase